MPKTNLKSILSAVGKTPEELAREAKTFSASAQAFSSNAPRFIDKYEDKWVAVHDGKVVATADSLEELTAAVTRKGLSPATTMIRHVDREKRTFIL